MTLRRTKETCTAFTGAVTAWITAPVKPNKQIEIKTSFCRLTNQLAVITHFWKSIRSLLSYIEKNIPIPINVIGFLNEKQKKL